MEELLTGQEIAIDNAVSPRAGVAAHFEEVAHTGDREDPLLNGSEPNHLRSATWMRPPARPATITSAAPEPRVCRPPTESRAERRA